MKTKTIFAAAAAIASLFAAASAYATTLTLNTGAFATATTGVAFQSEDFNGYNVSNLNSFDFGDFVATGPDFDVKSSSFCVSGACVTSIAQTITFTFDTAINALSFRVKSGSGETYVVDGNTVGTSGGAYDYTVGLYDLSTGFTSVTISAGGSWPAHLFDIDNMSYGQMAPVPLPASMSLMALGLGAAGLMMRRKRKAA